MNDSLRKAECAMYYHDRTNFRHGTETEDMSTFAAISHILERMSVCRC